MLLELNVSNLAVIEEQRLSLDSGLMVLTGATGAGKSLLVDALGLLLGGRAAQDMIRTGTSSARVDGVFDAPEPASTPALLLEEAGIEDYADEGVLVLSREVTARGRSIARVNGRVVPVSLLRELGGHLADIHGQSEHISLLDGRRHPDLLDAFGGLSQERQQLSERAVELRRLRKDLEQLDRSQTDSARHLDLLRYQTEEIQKAELQPGDDEALHQERERLSNVQLLQDAALSAYEMVTGGEGSGAIDLVQRAQASIRDGARLDPVLETFLNHLEDASSLLDDVGRGLRDYVDGLDLDPRRLAEVEERLDLISRLCRKYGGSIAEVLAYAHRAEEELSRSERHTEDRSALEQSIAAVEAEVGELAQRLSERRAEARHELETAVAAELEELEMGHVRFAVRTTREERADGLSLSDGKRYAFDSSGVDRIVFLLAANPGEELRPLARIASGGETSRLMLALKSALQRADAVPSLVFDELEAGVGGRNAEVLGRKLWALARHRQVLCITHLPQIACYGDTHIRATKDVVADRTFTRFAPLDHNERVDEVAAMLGGTSGRLQESARELLAGAGSWKGRHAPARA